MKNLDQMKAEIMAKAQGEIARAETEIAIREALPIQPHFVHVYSLYGSIGMARYNAVDAEHAMRVFRAFNPILPSFVCRNGRTVSIKAFNDENADSVTECLAVVEIEKHAQSVRFYFETPAGVVRVEIGMGFCPFGRYVVVDRHRTKYYRWEFRPNEAIGALLRVASYTPVSSYGEHSGGHYLYAVFKEGEIADQLGVELEAQP